MGMRLKLRLVRDWAWWEGGRAMWEKDWERVGREDLFRVLERGRRYYMSHNRF